MPREARLGLVLGLTLVVLIAVIFFRKDREPGGPHSAPAAVTAAPAPAAPPTASRTVPAQPARLADRREVQGVRHVVEEGDTLYSLARRYYKDDSRFVEIYQANRSFLARPDALPAGTVLVIPDPPAGAPPPADPTPAPETPVPQEKATEPTDDELVRELIN